MYQYLTGIFILIICLLIYLTYYYIFNKKDIDNDIKLLNKKQLYEKLKIN